MKFLVVSILIVVMFAGVAFAEDFTGLVVEVVDGDTITVLHGGQETKVRLNGIDCPEKNQAYGPKATALTSTMADGEMVTIKDYGLDKYGRTIGDVVMRGGILLNRELVKAGACWWYREYSSDQSLQQLESEARANRKGLWANAGAIPPWEFRHGGKGVGRRSRPQAVESLEPEIGQAVRGNRRSRIYHWPDCPHYNAISPRNRVPFSSASAAKRAGYRPARNCP